MMCKKLFRRCSMMVSLLAMAGLLVIVPASPALAIAPPAIANLNGDVVAYQENAAAVKIDNGGNATVTDDATGYNGGNVTLDITNSTANDNFGVDGVNVTSGGDATIAAGEAISVGGTAIGTVAAAPNDGQGGNDLVITLNANATDGRLSTLLQNITFANTSEDPNTTARTVAVTVTDAEDGPSAASTVTVNVTAVNDRPVITNLNGDLVTVMASGGTVAIDQNGNATVTDVDSADFSGGNLTITRTGGTANGSFGVDGTNVTSDGDATISSGEAISVGGVAIGTVDPPPNDGQDGNHLIISLFANSTPARVQTLIRNLTFGAPSGHDARTFSLTVDDGDGGTSTSVISAFTVTILPNPPVITNLNGDALNYDPYVGGAGVLDDGNDATVTDADSANFNNGTFTATITVGGTPAEDVLGIDTSGTVGVVGVTVSVGGTDIGTITSNGIGVPLAITFNANATPARVTELLRALTYENTNNVNPSMAARTITIVIIDYLPPADSRFKSVARNQALNGGPPVLPGVGAPALVTVNLVTPEINLKQGATNIPSGGFYDYGSRVVGDTTDVIFTIENTGTDNLVLTTPLVIAGANADQFSIQQQPVSPVAAGNTTTFVVRFAPDSTGAKTATITIGNSDANENPYNLTLRGRGIILSPTTPTTDIIYTSGLGFSIEVDDSGQVLFTYVYSSGDGVLSFTIPAGTLALDANGNPLTGITITTLTDPPPPPPGVNIVGPVFSIEPSGSTFDPPLTMTFCYEGIELPPGLVEESLTIAFYNETTGEWTVFECTVDPVTKTITATAVSHFTDFGAIGENPNAPAAPASFAVSGLSISPAEVEAGGTVTISVDVANSGGASGDYAVTLLVDDAALETTTVTLAAGGTGSVTFTLTNQPAGTHAVNVNGLNGSFAVTASAETTTSGTVTTVTVTPTAPTTTYATGAIPPEEEEGGLSGWWWLVIVGGIIVIGVVVWLATRRRD